MNFLNKSDLENLLPYDELIEALKFGFQQGGEIPLRHKHMVGDNTLLLMPSWQIGSDLGLKMTMVCPNNSEHDIESVQSTYILSDAETGVPKAIMDGDELTARRTSAASALASSYLSQQDASSMLMMGTGKLAPHLIHAHMAARNIKTVYIWGRRIKKAEILAKKMRSELPAEFIPVETASDYAGRADIISCATLSKEPIIKGEWLRETGGQHIDLVGAFTPEMRETDDNVILKSSIYVDTFSGALAEAGDILKPMNDGLITKNDIKGDLYDLTKGQQISTGKNETTLFKSVGTALEDLIAAKLAYKKYSALV